jgi:hypothetical protein
MPNDYKVLEMKEHFLPLLAVPFAVVSATDS